MPNIVITSYCNLKCPYCFAGQMINETKNKNITINQLENILIWLNKDNNHQQIGLIGGEPTLHPQINDILDIMSYFCNKYQKKMTLFTNGIYLEKIIESISNDMHLLININSPNTMTQEQFIKLNNNLDKIYNLKWLQKNVIASLGCNICQEINNYDFFWNILDKYSEIKYVRMSIVAPINKIALNDKEKYYNSLKTKFLNFIEEAKKRNLLLAFDCNQIPQCYFNQQELQLINNIANVKYKNPLCTPIIDITPDFKATSCFGIYNLIDCSLFNNFNELYNYFLYKQNVQLTLNNIQGKCITCQKHELLQCQGGCLAFAQHRQNN